MYQGKLVKLRAFDNSDLMYALSIQNDFQVMRTASSGILYPSTVEDQARFMSNQTSYTAGEYQFAIEKGWITDASSANAEYLSFPGKTAGVKLPSCWTAMPLARVLARTLYPFFANLPLTK